MPSAERLLAEWLAGQGGEERFEELLRAHPARAAELRLLRSTWKRLRTLPEAGSVIELERGLARILEPEQRRRLRALVRALWPDRGR